MTFEISEKDRIAYYWLTREDRENSQLQEALNAEYKDWKSKGYKVCTFVSGSGNLVELTKELLIHNKLILAQKALEAAEKSAVESCVARAER